MADKPNSSHHQQSTQSAASAPFPSTSSALVQRIHPSSTSTMASNVHHSEQPVGPMAHPASKETTKVDISSLMSPPDPVLDSFVQGQGQPNLHPRDAVLVANSGQSASTQQPLPMSPPISPFNKTLSTSNALPTQPTQGIKDPVLYPPEETIASSPPQPPLFAPTEIENHKRIIDDHVRARSSSMIFHGVTPPRRQDYELALDFRSQVMKHFTKNRKEWLLKERAFLVADRQAAAQRYHAIMPAKPIVAKPVRSQRADRVSKPRGSAPRPSRTNATGGSSRSPTRTTGVTTRPAARRPPSATPEPSRRIVAPNREDKDFGSLPDYCPPLNSLPNKANSLKVDWKGQPIDLSNDPHQHLLHPDEVILAGNLRLDCATYLTSKRRMFERRLQCLRTGKEFRKTDAQQACKIDVNKASKLWTAFDKVGWLDPEWVRRFL